MFIGECVAYTTKAARATAVVQSPPMTIQVDTDSKPDTAQTQRSYLESRARDIWYNKSDEIAEQFFLREPPGPKTVSELKERLKKGLYTITEVDEDDDDDGFYWRDVFSWRTAETQYDKAGYVAASKELNLFFDDIIDQIKILDPKEGLALLDDLKKWKPSKAKK